MDNIEILQKENLYKEGDTLIYGSVLPSFLRIAIYGSFFGTLTGMTNFVITRNKEGILIFPCNKVTNKVILDKKLLIPNAEISHFEVEKGNTGFYKISIMGKENKCLFNFQISVNVTQPIKDNLDKLFNGFECKNSEMLKVSGKTFGIICAVGLFAFCIILIGVAIATADIAMLLCGAVLLIWFISTLIKNKNKK